MPLRTASLHAARRVAAWQFVETAVVFRKSSVQDTTGGWIDTYTETASYQCSFSAYPITPIERENTVTIVAISFFRFLFAHDADIQHTDRLTVGSRDFEVVSSNVTSIPITREVIAQEIV